MAIAKLLNTSGTIGITGTTGVPMGPYEKKPPFSVGCASRVGSEGFSERVGRYRRQKASPCLQYPLLWESFTSCITYRTYTNNGQQGLE